LARQWPGSPVSRGAFIGAVRPRKPRNEEHSIFLRRTFAAASGLFRGSAPHSGAPRA